MSLIILDFAIRISKKCCPQTLNNESDSESDNESNNE